MRGNGRLEEGEKWRGWDWLIFVREEEKARWRMVWMFNVVLVPIADGFCLAKHVCVIVSVKTQLSLRDRCVSAQLYWKIHILNVFHTYLYTHTQRETHHWQASEPPSHSAHTHTNTRNQMKSTEISPTAGHWLQREAVRPAVWVGSISIQIDEVPG